MQKADLESGIQKRCPRLDSTNSKQYQIRAEVNKVTSNFGELRRDDIAEHYDLHCFESNTECLEFIDSPLANIKDQFPVAECVEGGVCGPNPVQRV